MGLALRVVLGVSGGVAEPVTVGDAVPLAVAACKGAALDDREVLPVMGGASSVPIAVGEALAAPEAACAELPVALLQGEASLAAGAALAPVLALPLGAGEGEPLGVWKCGAAPLGVAGGRVPVPEPVAVLLPVPVGEALAVPEAEGVGDCVGGALGVPLLEREGLPEREGEAP